jgi:peptidylprolyl isomerase
VSRRTRLRLLPVALVVALLALAGCGSSASSSSSASGTAEGLDAVTISGDVGKSPDVTWKSKMTASDVKNTTVIKGTGDTVASGDLVSAQLWVGNGTTQKEVYDTYQQGGAQSVTVNSQLSPVLADALTGATVGSRVAVTTPASKLFGPQGNSQLQIAATDPVLVIIDVISKPKPPLDGPKGTPKPSPAWAPKIVEKGTDVTSLNFDKTPKPNGDLRSAVLIQGSGKPVKKGQTITVNYLGQVYKGKKPFDESYSKSPATFQIGTGAVISGWDKTLVGQKIGSRLMLQIPPKDGYGAKGQPTAGIKGTDTLYFVVDILGAS